MLSECYFEITGAEHVGGDEIILLENLKSRNFTNSNRWDRLNRDEMFAVLKVCNFK